MVWCLEAKLRIANSDPVVIWILNYVTKYDIFQAHVRVWDTTSLETVTEFGHGYFERGVCAVSFSSGVSEFVYEVLL